MKVADDSEPALITRILLTSGEPAGIGPDLCVLVGQLPFPCSLTVIGDPDVLEERAKMLGVLQIPSVSPVQKAWAPRKNGTPGVAGVGFGLRLARARHA